MNKIHLLLLIILSADLMGACANAMPTQQVESTATPVLTETLNDPSGICTSVTEISSRECEALVSLYLYTDGEHWIMNKEEWNGTENNLSTLPPETGDLTNSSELYLSSNRLSSLPAEIGNMSSLSILILSDNNLSSIPPEMGGLTGLIALHLDGNDLNDLPSELRNLTNLSELELMDNHLTGLPPEVCAVVSGVVAPPSLCAP